MSETTFIYLAITTNGLSHEFHRRVDARDDVDDLLRATLGGWLEPVPLTDPELFMWCDEDGTSKGLTVNVVGSCLAQRLGSPARTWVGTLLVTGYRHSTTVSLSDEQLTTTLQHLSACR